MSLETRKHEVVLLTKNDERNLEHARELLSAARGGEKMRRYVVWIALEDESVIFRSSDGMPDTVLSDEKLAHFEQARLELQGAEFIGTLPVA